MFQGARPDPSRRRPEGQDQRFPLDHPRRSFGRQLNALPRDGARRSMQAVLEAMRRFWMGSWVAGVRR